MSSLHRFSCILLVALLTVFAVVNNTPYTGTVTRKKFQSVDPISIFNANGSSTCHCADGAGTSLAPSLRNLSDRWSRKNLIRYLKNPADYRSKDKRLNELSKLYAPVSMPAFAESDSTILEVLVGYLLKPEE